MFDLGKQVQIYYMRIGKVNDLIRLKVVVHIYNLYI